MRSLFTLLLVVGLADAFHIRDYSCAAGSRQLRQQQQLRDDRSTSSSSSSSTSTLYTSKTTALHVQASIPSGGTSSNGSNDRTTNLKFKNFEEVLATYHEEPMMVLFTAVNCGPCKLMKRELQQVKDMVDGKFKMFAVDTEKFPHIGSRFQISALPCVLLVQKGEPLLRMEGVVKAEEVVERVRTVSPILQ